jgi:hypothetical protein
VIAALSEGNLDNDVQPVRSNTSAGKAMNATGRGIPVAASTSLRVRVNTSSSNGASDAGNAYMSGPGKTVRKLGVAGVWP